MNEKPSEKPQAKMVKVKLLKTHTHGRKTYEPGAAIEVRENQADRLRKAGVAE